MKEVLSAARLQVVPLSQCTAPPLNRICMCVAHRFLLLKILPDLPQHGARAVLLEVEDLQASQ